MPPPGPYDLKKIQISDKVDLFIPEGDFAKLKLRKGETASWPTALRSGEFKQGKHKLAHVYVSSEGERSVHYCCLGVLAAVRGELCFNDTVCHHEGYVPEIENGTLVGLQNIGYRINSNPYIGRLGHFPDARIYAVVNGIRLGGLSMVNDCGGTFEEIAKIIELISEEEQ